MLEYQKSSAALGLATQLIVGGKFLNTITAVRSLSKKIAPQKSEARKTGGVKRRAKPCSEAIALETEALLSMG